MAIHIPRVSHDIRKLNICMNEQLIEQPASWDGIHVQYLSEFYQAQDDYKLFFSEWVEIYVVYPEHQKAITWLIKHHYKQRQSVAQDILSVLFLMSNEVDSWEARLHLLQIMPYIFIPREVYPQVEAFVRSCLETSRTFVGAWSTRAFTKLPNTNRS